MSDLGSEEPDSQRGLCFQTAVEQAEQAEQAARMASPCCPYADALWSLPPPQAERAPAAKPSALEGLAAGLV